MLSLRIVLSSQLILSVKLHSWKHCRHSRLRMQRWILWQRHHVLSMQDVLTVRHANLFLFRQYNHRHAGVQMQLRILRRWLELHGLRLCSDSPDDNQLSCWQHSKRPQVCLQRWLLRQRPQLLSLQIVHNRKLSLSS